MNKTVNFHVCMKLHAKERPRFDKRTGRVFNPKTNIEAESTIMNAYIEQCGSFKFEKDVPIAMNIVFYVKDENKINHSYAITKQDVDNLLKTVCDALNKIAYHDDRQIVEIHACRKYSQTCEGLYCKMSEVNENDEEIQN